MGIWEIIIGALVLIFSVIMIIVIILQEGHQAGLGTITGGADSFLSRGKARTADAIFARVTKYCAIAFFIFVIALNAIQYFMPKNTAVDTSSETSVVSQEESEDESTDESASSEAASAAESKAESASSQAASAAESKTESASSEAASVAESTAESVSSEG